jgi:hypothetical protein
MARGTPVTLGYTSDSGAHGQRGYFGNYMFVWAGAVVDIPYRVHTRSVNIGTSQKRIEALRMVGRPVSNAAGIITGSSHNDI